MKLSIQLHFISYSLIHINIHATMNIKLKNRLTNFGSSGRTRPFWVVSCDVLCNNRLIALICATSKLLSRLSRTLLNIPILPISWPFEAFCFRRFLWTLPSTSLPTYKMGRAEAGSTKAIGNKIKSKGLGRLRWFCQACEKQCRDENGFKCHTMTEAHGTELHPLSPGHLLTLY